MKNHDERIDSAMHETDAMLLRAARMDAAAARELSGNPAGVTLEDRVFGATRGVLSSTSPVATMIEDQ